MNIVVLSVIADCLVLLMVVSAVNIKSAVVLNACRVGAEYIRRNWISRIFQLLSIFAYFLSHHLIVFLSTPRKNPFFAFVLVFLTFFFVILHNTRTIFAQYCFI